MNSSHETKKRGKHKDVNNEWLTPPRILNALGPFDLDPCAPVKRPWEMAGHHYTYLDNGLAQPWFGFVWCNPPYGDLLEVWLRKCAQHGNGLALTFVRSDTAAFQNSAFNCDAMLFLQGRIRFLNTEGQPGRNGAGAPSVFMAWGEEAVRRLTTCRLNGKLVFPKLRPAGVLPPPDSIGQNPSTSMPTLFDYQDQKEVAS